MSTKRSINIRFVNRRNDFLYYLQRNNDFDENNGVKLLPLGAIQPIIRDDLVTMETDEVDFAIKKSNTMPPYYFFAVDEYGKIKFKQKRIQIISNLDDLPKDTEEMVLPDISMAI